ncbi:MAG: M23 family metallopeptidase [Bacteroidota bacterium]
MLKAMYQKWRQKLLKNYRVEVIDEITLSQRQAFSLKPIRVILLTTIFSLLLIGGTSALIFYVPFIRKQIPGYLNPAVKQQQQDLMEKVKTLAHQIEDRDSLIKTLQNSVLEGENLPEYTNLSSEGYSDEPQSSVDILQEPGPEVLLPPISATIASGEESMAELIPVTTDYISPIQNLFRPVKNGTVSNPFNVNKQHFGIDLVAKEEEPVHAAADGFVIIAEYHEGSGYVIGVSSRDDVLTFYKHNSVLYKKIGDFVSAGSPIAMMGNSGENSTGPHLHFELWYKGVPKDPALYISFK